MVHINFSDFKIFHHLNGLFAGFLKWMVQSDESRPSFKSIFRSGHHKLEGRELEWTIKCKSGWSDMKIDRIHKMDGHMIWATLCLRS